MKKKILLLALLPLLLSSCWITTTNGRHNGQIIAVDKSGPFFQTWDVYIKSDISSSQEEMYCVRDESLIPQLQEFSKLRQKVTIKYYDVFIVSPFACNGGEGIISGIET